MQKTSQTRIDRGAPPSARGRRTLILVAFLFLLPVVAATALYVSGWRPEGKSLQHGELVQPARPVGDAELTGADGAPFRLNALRGKWVFVYFGPLLCTEACRNSLYKMQQVRLAQGRDAVRVERVMIVADADASALRELAQQNPGMVAVSGTRAILLEWLGGLVARAGRFLRPPLQHRLHRPGARRLPGEDLCP